MLERQPSRADALVARSDQPLIGVIFFDDDGQEVVRYTTQDSLDSTSSSSVTEQALSVIGAWSDLDWDEMEVALDRIRHDSVPTPPIDL